LKELLWWLIRLGRAGGWRAIGLLAVWLSWERLTELVWRPQSVRPGGFFRYRIVRYRGPTMILADGTRIEPGDTIVELHFDNRRLLQLWLAGASLPWELLRLAREDLAELACRIARGELGEVRALTGVTLFARAGRRLGFQVEPAPPTWYTRLQRFSYVGLIAIYHPLGWRMAERYRERAWPGRAWMSRASLLARYGAGCWRRWRGGAGAETSAEVSPRSSWRSPHPSTRSSSVTMTALATHHWQMAWMTKSSR